MDTAGLTAQEYVDIQNLYAAYNLASDAGDAEAYASCFTEDGVLRIEPLGVTVRGRAGFIAFKQKDAAGRGGKYRRHWNGSLHLEKIDPDTVRGRCYFHGYNGTPGEPPTPGRLRRLRGHDHPRRRRVEVRKAPPHAGREHVVGAGGPRRGVPLVSDDITRRSASELASDIPGRKLGAPDVIAAFLARVARLNPA